MSQSFGGQFSEGRCLLITIHMRKVLGGAQPPRARAMVRRRSYGSGARSTQVADEALQTLAILSGSSSLYCLHSARAQGGLPGRRLSPQQTTDFHRTMAKVCKSGGEGTFAERHGNGEVAPIPDFRALAPELGGSTRFESSFLLHTAPYQKKTSHSTHRNVGV